MNKDIKILNERVAKHKRTLVTLAKRAIEVENDLACTIIESKLDFFNLLLAELTKSRLFSVIKNVIISKANSAEGEKPQGFISVFFDSGTQHSLTVDNREDFDVFAHELSLLLIEIPIGVINDRITAKAISFEEAAGHYSRLMLLPSELTNREKYITTQVLTYKAKTAFL